MSPCKDVCSVHQLIFMHIALGPDAFIFKDTPAYIYIHIIQVIHLHNFTYTWNFALAASPRHSTCEATHPSVGHGVNGAAWLPANISSGTLKKNLLRAFVPLVVAHSLCQYIFEAATTCALKFQLVGSGFQLTCEYPYVFIHFQNGRTMISIEFLPPGCSFRLVATASRCSNDSHWLNQ